MTSCLKHSPRWLRKPALNWSSAVVKAQVAVVEDARVRRHTGNAQSFEVVNVTDNFIIHECWSLTGNSKAAVCILFLNQGPWCLMAALCHLHEVRE